MFNCRFEKNFDQDRENKKLLLEDFSRVLLNLFNNAYYALKEKKKMGGERPLTPK